MWSGVEVAVLVCDGGKAEGIDISPLHIEQARERWEPLGVLFHHGDVCDFLAGTEQEVGFDTLPPLSTHNVQYQHDVEPRGPGGHDESSWRKVMQAGGVVTMTAAGIGARIERARAAAGSSRRALAEATGISQPTLSRIISEERVAKMPELVAIAWETGHTIAQLTGTGTVTERVQYAARVTNDSDVGGMRQALLDFLELDAYLDDQAIPATV